MKKLFILFTILSSVIACKEKSAESIIGLQFKDYKKINQLTNFNKVSDTTLFGNASEPKLGLLHLNNGKEDLVIFARIWNDTENLRNYKVLDTLTFSNLDEKEKLTIGYCGFDLKNQDDGNIIALAENIDSKNMFITRIKEAWVANPNSRKIEQLKNIDEIDCFNEGYNGKTNQLQQP